MPYLENHLLYYKKSCPYCQKVLRFMEDNKITMDTRDTLQPGNQNDLVRIGGKKQVPCLVVNGKPLYESDDIIAYLRTHAWRCVRTALGESACKRKRAPSSEGARRFSWSG